MKLYQVFLVLISLSLFASVYSEVFLPGEASFLETTLTRKLRKRKLKHKAKVFKVKYLGFKRKGKQKKYHSLCKFKFNKRRIIYWMMKMTIRII
jgi:hypothetical protein